MKQVIYTETNEKKSFADFIHLFGSGELDSEVMLDDATGTGTIRLMNIEEGLQLRLWDCTFNAGFEIFRQANDDKQHRTFTIVYYLTPLSFVIKENSDSSAVSNTAWNNVLISSDAEFKVSLLPGRPFRCVSINFSAEWVQKNVLGDVTDHNTLLHRFGVSARPLVLFESLSSLESKLSGNLFDISTQKLFGKFFWRSKILNLLTAFFSKVVNRLSVHHGVESYHEEQMVKVQKELEDNIYTGLPDIKTLAKKIAVSESTLKRYFRRIYGKNIYNYFLEKRMLCAKRLLTDKKKTVSETAFIMGYENISHFSTTFKRFFGLLPGALRKLHSTAGDA